jgi:uncharacterized protein (TIGR02466 family)
VTTDQAQAQDVDLGGHSAMIFGTPIVAYPWPDSDVLNGELGTLILEAEQRSDGMHRSNVGGWHSDTDFFKWDAGCVRLLQQRIQQITVSLTKQITLTPEGPRSFNYRLDGWANVSRRGNYNTVHNHPNCVWSGTYYVSAGEPDADAGPHNGKLELLDPRVGANMLYIRGTVLESRYVIDPIPGLMVMFPSWISHLVHPFHGDGDRISIAFNILTTEVPTADQLA